MGGTFPICKEEGLYVDIIHGKHVDKEYHKKEQVYTTYN